MPIFNDTIDHTVNIYSFLQLPTEIELYSGECLIIDSDGSGQELALSRISLIENNSSAQVIVRAPLYTIDIDFTDYIANHPSDSYNLSGTAMIEIRNIDGSHFAELKQLYSHEAPES